MKHSDLTAWSFIPADAAVVIEAELIEDLETFQGYSVSSILNESSGLRNLRNGLAFLDSINGDGGFTAIFDDAPTVTSAHKVSSDEIDFLFVIELQNISQNTFANAAIGRLKQQGYRFKTRNYNDFKISEISRQGKTLTFIFYKNFFLASFTPYLIEDAVRAVNDEEMMSFQERFTELNETGVTGLAAVFVNYQKFGELLRSISSNEVVFPIEAGNYELVLDSSFIQLSGFSYSDEGWIATHKNQPAPFEMAEVVPENTAYFYHITSMAFSTWKEEQINYLRSSNPSIKAYQDSLKSQYDFYADQVFDLVDNEIGIVHLESPRVRDQQKMFLIEVKNREESLNFFSQLTERVALARNDSVYTESYSENEIRFLPISEFPSTIMGNLAAGFEQCFYISYRNYIIFSNDLQGLKNLISAIKNEDTWGKSISMNNFLARANNAANVSLFVNIPRAWTSVQNLAKTSWNDHFAMNAPIYKTMDMAAFQFSYIDGRYYTNYTFSQPVKRSRSIPKTSAENGVRFVSKLVTKPHLLRTHAHKKFDILVQDSTNAIYYMDSDQNTLWSKTIDGQIISKIHPIDYYKNGKLQYLFSTDGQIHMVDRTGADIPGYPKTLPEKSSIEHLNLIDYDLSRNYRVAITDIDGRVFLTDKDLNVLDGWNPKALRRKALLPMDHSRLGRFDVMISLQENGAINLMNRRGQMMSGFPFDTRQTLDNSYFLRKSNALGTSSMTVISKGGELTELNLEGDVIKRDQLIKTSADARFRLIPDTGGDSFIVVRKEGNTYDVLDDTGNLLFKKDYLSEGPILIQYYQFGAGKDLVIFTDKANKTLYIYDKSGNLITGNPLNSENEVSLIYSSAKREFQVFTTWDANLELYNFNY